MKFGAPLFLWFLLLAPLLGLFLWWAWRERQKKMTQFIHARLLTGLLADHSAGRYKLRSALILLATTLLVVVMARPQWGFHLEEVKQRGLDVVVAIDTSRSMLAADVNPNRLARAKLEVMALKQLCRSDRLGLVAFAGSAFLQCPLSLDDDAFRQSLETLDANVIPQGGTALAEAIRTALTAFKEKTENHRILVLFSDGEDHDGDALEAAKEAAEQGMRIFTIGVGTPNGELISVQNTDGKRTFLKDSDGNAVKSHLNESLLKEIAAAANGFYLPLSGAQTMDTLYQRGLAPLPKTDSEVKTMRQYHERFQWFLFAAILLLLAEILMPDAPRGEKIPRANGIPALPVLLFFLIAGSVTSIQAASAGNAMKEYKKGNFDRALSEYEKLATKKPDDARLQYNAGTAAYQDKQYETALNKFSSSLSTPDTSLQERSFYNLGNTHFRIGEDESTPDKKQTHWKEAISNYESALKLNPKDEQARHNMEFVKRKLEELQQQQQQNKDKNDNKDNKDDKNDKKDQQDQQKKNDQKDQQNQQNKQDKNDQQGQNKEQKQDGGKDDKKEQQPQPQPQDKQEQKKPEQQQDSSKKEDKQDQQDSQPQQARMMQMTPQQARQLMDAQKSGEKTLIFLPPAKTNQQNRIFKNW